MTDLRKLASKYAEGMANRPELLVRDAIVRALKEFQTRVVLDVKRSSPATELVADRIVRNRPIPYARANYGGAQVQARIEYKDIVIYASEHGRLLERREREAIEHAGQQVAAPENEFGGQWKSGATEAKTFPIYGATSLQQAKHMLDQVVHLDEAIIMTRTMERAGDWRAAE